MNAVRAYLQPRLLAVLLLGIASGLPYLLVGSTLAAWLAEAGLDKSTLGLFAWVAVPAGFKFLWAPLLDHVRLPVLTRFMGRRRSWMLVFQLLLAGAIFLLASLDPLQQGMQIAALAVVIAVLSASFDIVVDAFRAEYLKREQYGEGAAVAVFGYRLGMLFAGAGALAMADQINWSLAFQLMAGLMALTGIVTLLVREPEVPEAAPAEHGESWLSYALLRPFRDFISRHPHWLLMLVFILFYRLPDGFIAFLSTPFYLEMGFTKTQVAFVAKLYGFIATTLGMLVGGYLLRRYAVERNLWWFGWLQFLTCFLPLLLIALPGQTLALVLVISADNFIGGLLTAALIAYLMRLCNLQFTATQYALLSALATFSARAVAGFAGMVVENHGWAAMFLASAVLAAPGMVALWRLRRGDKGADVIKS